MTKKQAEKLLEDTLFWKNYNDAIMSDLIVFKCGKNIYTTNEVRTALRGEKKPVKKEKRTTGILTFD